MLPLIGMQEVLHEQLVDIVTGLRPEWSYIGTGCEDGAAAGEYCPIFFQPGRLRLLDSRQKWLSPTLDAPSFWPGAGSRRYVLVAIFEEVGSGLRFITANTHLDNASSAARSEGVKIALRVIHDVQAQWGTPDELPVSLLGDFNSQPSGDAYAAMVADGYLADSHTLADEVQRFWSV
jgi:endonuclease/exonuclease/phosphatase family metal-dependent hydrolase